MAVGEEGTKATAGEGRDPRVEAAAAHWGPRFVNNGTDYLDFELTVAKITRWEDWCAAWGETAKSYEAIAERAEAAGHTVTAMEAWRRAGMCWHWAKFVFVIDPDQLRAAHDRTVACFAKGAAGLDPPAERVLVPYAGTDLAAYLRLPTTAGGPPPVVVMAPGLDSVKEELQATADYFLARGMATLTIDGPGQGESEWTLPIEPAYEKAASASVDFLERRDDIDAQRIGFFGVSLGGYYAARAMAYEPRLVAGIALAGPYRFDREWDTLPPMTRDTFRHRSGSADDAAARAYAAKLTLEDAARRITHPLLVVHGALDRLIGRAQAEQIVAEAPGAEMRMYEDGNHGVANHAFESRSGMADWMAEKLGALGGRTSG